MTDTRPKKKRSRGPVADLQQTAGENGSIGVRLRALRHDRELTLAEVARGTSISASFLSLVENGRSDITIGRLTRLCQFYRTPLSDLLPETDASHPGIVHEQERRHLHSAAEGMDIYMLAPESDRGMMPMLLVFEPGGGRKDYGRHAGQEFLFILEGELVLELDGSEPRLLRAGDAACYPAERSHLLRNASARKPLRLICVDSTRVL